MDGEVFKYNFIESKSGRVVQIISPKGQSKYMKCGVNGQDNVCDANRADGIKDFIIYWPARKLVKRTTGSPFLWVIVDHICDPLGNEK